MKDLLQKHNITLYSTENSGGHDLAKFRISMIHRFMTSHPVAELLLCFRARHKDGRPMLFGFLVIFTHRLTELCISNAENVMTKQRRFSIILTINIMQVRGMSWRVLRCFKTSVANVLRLLRPLI